MMSGDLDSMGKSTKFESLKEAIEKKDTELILNLVSTFLKDQGIYLLEKPTFFTAKVDKGEQLVEVVLFYPTYYIKYIVYDNDEVSLEARSLMGGEVQIKSED